MNEILTVCTGNLCRSPMAAALLMQRLAGRGMTVRSAGLSARTGTSPPAMAVRLMAQHGLDISGHRAERLTIAAAFRATLILTMESWQRAEITQRWPLLRGRIFQLGAWRGQDIVDPYGQSAQVYAACLDRMSLCVDDWGSRLGA